MCWTTCVCPVSLANHSEAPALVTDGGFVASASRRESVGRGTVGLTTWIVVLHAARTTDETDRQIFQLSVRAATAAEALFEGLDQWRGAGRGTRRAWGLRKVEVTSLREVERLRGPARHAN